MNGAESLRKMILERFPTIHAFCAAHPELKRSTVYMVTSGKYPGRFETQAIRIRAALEGIPQTAPTPSSPSISRDELIDALKDIRCNHCRRLDRRGCFECKSQTDREARELYARIFLGRHI